MSPGLMDGKYALCKHVQRHNKVGSSSRTLTKIVLSSAYSSSRPWSMQELEPVCSVETRCSRLR